MDNNDISKVINRRGEEVDLDYNKILNRLTNLINMEPKLNISPHRITIKTIEGIYNKIHTYELDDLSSKICGSLITTNPDYSKLASRIEISNLHKETSDCFLQTLYNANSYKNINNNDIILVNPKLIKITEYYEKEINNTIDYSRDYNFEYFGILTLKKSYLLKNINEKRNIILERPQHLYMRVALGIHLCYTDDNGKLQEPYNIDEVLNTYELLSKGLYSHATPTLFNAGTNTSSLSSCFLLNVDDNLNHIYKTLSDTAKISKWSGGIGICTTDVRAKGSLIKGTNGISDGLVPMLKVFNDSACYVNQGGGKRKGSTAVYLEPWHADINEFLDLKKPIGDEMLRARDLFLALWIPDIFMERLILAVQSNNTVLWSLMCPNECPLLTKTYGEEFTKAYLEYEKLGKFKKQINILDLWKHILEIQMEAGMPYIMYKDHVNSKCNQNSLGIIKSSNLCVSGDTQILTDQGYEKIEDLAGMHVNIWNGSEFSESPVAQTGENQELLKIITDDGCELNCTYYHKFKIQIGTRKENFKTIEIEAQQLKEGMRLIKYKFPIIDGDSNYDMKYPYTHGLYCADGTNHNYDNGERRYPNIDLYDEKQNLLPYLNYERKGQFNKKNNKLRIVLSNNISNKFEVPHTNSSLQCKLDWLSGLLDGDGCMCKSKNNNLLSLQLFSIHKEFLMKVKLLCNTLGCNPKIKLGRKEGQRMMPINDGSGESKLYNCKKQYRILFDSIDTYHLYNNLQLPTKRLTHNGNKPNTLFNRNVKIQSIEKVEGLYNTYCFNEPIKHQGIFNGLLSAQCAEINIYTDTDNIGVCNLASLTLSKYVEYNDNNEPYLNYDKLYEVTKTVTYNLNKVIDNNHYPIPEGKFSDKQNRPIGIGVSGLADVFILFRCSYTSNKAKELNKKIFETMYYATMTASNELAIKFNKTYPNFNSSMLAKGILQPDLWNIKPSFNKWDWDTLRTNITKYGSYNSMNIALMPTASTASILGTSENFEPITANIYVRRVLSGTFQIVNKYLIRDLIKQGIWNNDLKQKILANDGSVQGIPEINTDIQEIYQTAWEYRNKDLIDMDRDRGAYVCQSCSSNRFIAQPNTNILTSMHIHAWKLGLKTSSYYIRSKTITNAVKFNVDVNIIKNMEKNKENKQQEIVCEEDQCNMCSA